MPHPMNPPGVVRGNVDLKVLAADCHAAAKAGDDCMKGAIKHYKRCGDLLWKIRKNVGPKQWIAWVEANLKFNRTQAWKYMRVSKCWSKCLLESEHLNDAVKMISEACTPPDEKDAGPQPDPEPAPQDTGSKLIQGLRTYEFSPKIMPRIEALEDWQQEALLARLQEAIHVFPALDQVEALRIEPGDDTPADKPAPKDPAKPTNGQVIVNRKALDSSIGKLIRAVDRVGNAYHVKETVEAEALRKSAYDFRVAFLAWNDSLASKR